MQFSVTNRWKPNGKGFRKQLIVISLNDGNTTTTQTFTTTITQKMGKQVSIATKTEIERLKRTIEKEISQNIDFQSVMNFKEAKNILKPLILSVTHPLKVKEKPHNTLKTNDLKKVITINEVAELKFYQNPISKSRKHVYSSTLNHINSVFPNKDITTYTKMDLAQIGKFIDTKGYAKNSEISIKKAIAALFNFSLENDIIEKNVIPKGFTSTFIQGKRDILSETDYQKIINLSDISLPSYLLRAKYTLILQCETALAFCDLKNLKHENLKQDNEGYYLSLNRAKTGEPLLIPLSKNGINAIENLKADFPSKNYLFQSTTIGNTTTQYKKLASIIGNTTTNITTYTGRIFLCRKLAQSNISEQTRKQLIGNSNEIFRKVYIHTNEGNITNMREDMRKLSGGATI